MADHKQWDTRLEVAAVALVGLFAIALHLRFFEHVGALWRDECNSVNLATLPTFTQLLGLLEFDSFPILYAAILRLWTGIFGADNDFALRGLGLAIGIGLLGALWWNARTVGTRLPILSLALIGLNPMMIRYGDSIRAYGLGVLLILLTLSSFWRLVDTDESPSRKRIAVATICALLSVQCLYYNAVLLFAIAMGAVAVAARRRAWRTVAIILAIGFVAALSLLPYAPIMFRMRAWTFLVTFPVGFVWLWKRASEVTGSPFSATVWLWAALVLGGIFFVAGHALFDLVRQKTSRVAQLPAPVLFAVIALPIGLLGYACFLRMLSYYTQPWYYIALAAFVAGLLEILFGAWPVIPRAFRPIIALTLLVATGWSVWDQMAIRHTNADLLAARLKNISHPGDLILVPRWEMAISFLRYYDGPAETVTLPPLTDHRFHRYDLILAQMKTPDAHLPVLQKMAETLQAGHRVYIAGHIPLPEADATLPVLHPFYRDENGATHGSGYATIWQLYAGQFLTAHAVTIGSLKMDFPGYERVQEFEKFQLNAAEGWK